MYAISFDMTIADLRRHYGEPYQGAYWEVKQELSKITCAADVATHPASVPSGQWLL